jgi:general secretion pathway protein G
MINGYRWIRSASRNGRERGMTLIEILVVLTLIGVVLGSVGSN